MKPLYTLAFLTILALQGAFCYGQTSEQPTPPAPAPGYAIPTQHKGRTYVVKDGKWTPGDGKQTAKYTILYYAAGWCSTCRMNVPHNVELYKKLIKNNPSVELVMFNMDRSAEFAEKWATDNKMPWPVLLQKDFPPDLHHLMPLGIPTMILLDKDGRAFMRSPNLTQLLKAV